MCGWALAEARPAGPEIICNCAGVLSATRRPCGGRPPARACRKRPRPSAARFRMQRAHRADPRRTLCPSPPWWRRRTRNAREGRGVLRGGGENRHAAFHRSGPRRPGPPRRAPCPPGSGPTRAACATALARCTPASAPRRSGRSKAGGGGGADPGHRPGPPRIPAGLGRGSFLSAPYYGPAWEGVRGGAAATPIPPVAVTRTPAAARGALACGVMAARRVGSSAADDAGCAMAHGARSGFSSSSTPFPTHPSPVAISPTGRQSKCS